MKLDLRPLPLAGADALLGAARRSRRRFALLFGVLALVLGAVYFQARALPAASAGDHRPQLSAGVVVVDVSGSMEGLGDRTTRRALDALYRRSGAGTGLGLAVYSDSALSILPPTASRRTFREAVFRYLAPRSSELSGSSASERSLGGSATGASPLLMLFGGTRISTGLVAAEAALERSGVRRGHIYLISDLVDSDWRAAAKVVSRLKRKGISLWTFKVQVPAASGRQPLESVDGLQLVTPRALPRNLPVSSIPDARVTTSTAWPLLLVVLSAVAALLVAVLAAAFPRLRFQRDEVIA